ncbi:4Fe-4S dicluster domain-containing protein [Desulfospira joergensenii]|uniref:4Fe-4S dicluster domain-containing protein n=1 Tax=Desulfospira joergensenii TaxID=53329 RepID=UPI001FCA12AE|nr:4Fe-4S dicluster domain-containing protein [Desulfospira joergensenii]
MGLSHRFIQFFRVFIGPKEEAFSFLKRISGFFIGGLGILISPVRLFRLFRSLILDVILQVQLLRQDFLKWIMHMFIFYGFTGLVLFHALEGFISEPLFSDYASTLNPFMTMRNVLGVMVIIGIAIAMGRRRKISGLRLISKKPDYIAIALLGIIIFSGFLLEASKIVSSAVFDEMMVDWGDMIYEEELPALKVFWQEEFNVVFPGEVLQVTPGALEEGETLHDDNCMGCHSRPQWAFASYGLSMGLRPWARFFNEHRLDTLIWVVHFISCFAGLAYLPFSKFLHILTSPVSILTNGISGQLIKRPENKATRRAFDIQACTRCGTCTLNCSVGPVYRIISNPYIFPSERVEKIRETATGDPFDPESGRSFTEGSFICTECNRCSQLCPAGMDLQDIWIQTRNQLAREPSPDPMAGLRTDRVRKGLLSPRDKVIPIASGQKNPDLDLLKKSLPAQTFSYCYKCRSCTNSCPVVSLSKDPQAFGTAPHQIIHSLSLGLMDKALNAPMIWDCLTCYQCQESCPQGVRVTDIFYEMRNIAYKQEYQS